jgi:hypothetical protein
MHLRARRILPVAIAGIVLVALVLATRASSAMYAPEPSGPITLGVVDYLCAFRTPADVKGKPSGFRNFLNQTLGLEDDYRRMVLPHGVAVDS